MKKSFFNFLFSFLFLSSISYAQNKSNEIGVRLSSSDDLDITWHKKISDQKYKRLRLSSFALNLNSNDAQPTRFNFSTTVGLGTEKRKSLNDNFYFIHGFELGAGLGLSVNGNKDLIFLSPYLGYVIGFQYFVNPNLAISFEALPRINFDTQINDGDVSTIQVSTLGLNGQSIALTAKYCFSKTEKS
jgi:hypothetical protein